MRYMNHTAYKRMMSDFTALLSYPHPDNPLERLLSQRLPRRTHKALEAMQEQFVTLSLAERQELFTKTFDLSPLCSPALSVHLFGIESFKRSHLMVGLLDMYKEAAYAAHAETADHMHVVVNFVSHVDGAQRDEIIDYILVPALTKMAELLTSKQNCYSYACEALLSAIGAARGAEVDDA